MFGVGGTRGAEGTLVRGAIFAHRQENGRTEMAVFRPTSIFDSRDKLRADPVNLLAKLRWLLESGMGRLQPLQLIEDVFLGFLIEPCSYASDKLQFFALIKA